jgi:putative ubiquitin-RnfH superfamily antitoxin RatB of RatAB toxin-antitoxin module
MGADDIVVEVAYALPQEQVLLALRVPRGTTVQEAVERSGIGLHYPEIDLARNAVGIFGRIASPQTPLESGDRVEIYRPLMANPKETRRRRAARRNRPVGQQ